MATVLGVTQFLTTLITPTIVIEKLAVDVEALVIGIAVDEVTDVGEEVVVLDGQHCPQPVWQPAEQKADVLPHHPYCEQQYPESHLAPLDWHCPLVEIGRPTVHVGADAAIPRKLSICRTAVAVYI